VLWLLNWSNETKDALQFSFVQLTFPILEFQPNKLAFWTIQQLKPMQKETVASAIELCHRTNLACIAAFELVKWNEKRPPIFVRSTHFYNSWISTEQTSFLNRPTTQANIEGDCRVRNLILPQDESSLHCSLWTGEMKRKTSSNFRSFNSLFQFLNFNQTN
jgi:hypothetical protein